MEILILAAGRGSRFYPHVSKIFANFWGIKVVDLIIAQAYKGGFEISVLLNESTEIVVPQGVKKVIQKKAYGTAAAVQSYLTSYPKTKELLIIPGDSPLIDDDTLRKFVKHKKDNDVLIGIMKTPAGHERYGRIIRHEGKIIKIMEYKHYMEKTEYVNTGIIYLKDAALKLVNSIQQHEQGEYYLTDIVELAHQNGLKIDVLELDADEALGFNTVAEFHNLLSVAQNKWRTKAIQTGAIFFDIDSTYLSYDTQFAPGAIIEPCCKFLPGVIIGENAVIKSFSYLENCYIEGIVGPFAHIKSGAVLENAQVGAFVEMKKSVVGKNTKIKHLAYIGDAVIGENVNIGAGVVFCNYDGKKKHETKIADNAFIGANSALIAPIEIGHDAFLAAGGVYSKNVEPDQLAVARAKQINTKRRK